MFTWRTSNCLIMASLYRLNKTSEKTCTCFTLPNLNLSFRWNHTLLTTSRMANRRVPKNNYRIVTRNTSMQMLYYRILYISSTVTGSHFRTFVMWWKRRFESYIVSLYSKRISHFHNRIMCMKFERLLPEISRIHAINNLDWTHYVYIYSKTIPKKK